MTFRRRILAAMLPLFVLLAALGGTGAILIYDLGQQTDKILRDNYDSVVYMRELSEAVEGIDSTFQFVLSGREKQSRQQYEDNWKIFDAALAKERGNVSLPGEQECVDRLGRLGQAYRRRGDQFFAAPAAARDPLYFGRDKQPGLSQDLLQIKEAAGRSGG